MNRASREGWTRRHRRLLILGAIVMALGLIAIIGRLSAPRLTESLLDKQLTTVESRTGIALGVGRINTRGISRVELADLTITHPESDATLGTIGEVHVVLDPWKTLRGAPTLKSLTIRDAHFHLERRADGSHLFNDLKEQILGDGSDPSPVDSADLNDDAGTSQVQRLLRHFGGQYPQILVENASLEFTSQGTPWPLQRISAERFTLESGREFAPFETILHVESTAQAGLQLPEQIDIQGALHLPVDRSTITVELEPPLQVADLPRLPFLEVSIAGFAVGEDYSLQLKAPRIDTVLGGESQPLVSAAGVDARLEAWSSDPRELSLLEFEVDSLRLFLEFHESGASNISELMALLRRTAAENVHSRARQITAELDRRKRIDAGELQADDPAKLDEPAPGLRERLRALPIQRWLTDYLPQRSTFRDFRLVVDDARHHDRLTRPSPHFEIRGELIDLVHRPIQGLLKGEMKFQIETEDDIARTDITLSIPYRSGDWDADVEIDGLQLAQFAQLGGPGVARHLHGGEISATINVGNDGGQQQISRFDGLLAVKELRLHHGSIAEAPVEVAAASLHLDGFYDPSLPLPAPELIEEGRPDIDDNQAEFTESDLAAEPVAETEPGDADETAPPDQGAFIIENGTARIGGASADFSFAVHGLEAGRLPNRATLQIDLDTTELSTLIEAVPAAIRGPLDGMRMHGDLQWQFHLEVPLYEARNMRWDAEVVLSDDFQVLYLPPAVDVFKLVDAFEHTIEDEWKQRVRYRERQFSYRRTVSIPAMRPTPATWLLANTSLDIEAIDRVRRKREWPVVPAWNYSLGLTRDELNSPAYWLSSHALSQAAPRPWSDPAPAAPRPFWQRWVQPSSEPAQDDILRYEQPDPLPSHQTQIRIDPDRYGDYIYVPLHHISPYLPLAIMTTEDTSFFTHSGFNFLAIRQSVQTNLERGRFHRGASTISMQLAKNLFLNRDRVLARKLQEVALVWLMESVADIPKARLMELYLNIIEYGPGIFGIHEASMHYFGKRPDALTIAEVAWLVSIVPSPKRYHSHYDRGEISPYWLRRMGRYIRAMYRRDRITEQEMEQALEEIPAFYIPEDGEPLLRVYAEAEPVESPYLDHSESTSDSQYAPTPVFDGADDP